MRAPSAIALLRCQLQRRLTCLSGNSTSVLVHDFEGHHWQVRMAAVTHEAMKGTYYSAPHSGWRRLSTACGISGNFKWAFSWLSPRASQIQLVSRLFSLSEWTDPSQSTGLSLQELPLPTLASSKQKSPMAPSLFQVLKAEDKMVQMQPANLSRAFRHGTARRWQPLL